MESAGAAHGATANTNHDHKNELIPVAEWERTSRNLLAELASLKTPETERETGTMRKSASDHVTMFPDGMMYDRQTRSGQTKTEAVWFNEPEPNYGPKGWVVFLLVLMTLVGTSFMIEVTWPIFWFVFPYITTGAYMAVRRMRHPGKRADCTRCASAQEAAQRPVRRTWDPYPRQAPYADTDRIGDAERDAVIKELTAHMIAGRINADEFQSRMDDALKARTHRELIPVLNSLPFLDIKERVIS